VKYALLLAFLLPCSAKAVDPQISRYELEQQFRALDLDGDGYVSAAEAAGFGDIVTRFDKADRNRDGKLSPAEYARLKTMKPKRSHSAAGGTAARRESRPKP
jgi:Ca2+-binding EF-hand superfamily protein